MERPFSKLMGRGKKNAKVRDAHNAASRTKKQTLWGNERETDLDQYEDDDKEKLSRSDRRKELLDGQDDFTLGKKKRVGRPHKPYLGKRVTASHRDNFGRRVQAEHLIDFITDPFSSYGRGFPEHNTQNGRASMGMLYEMFGKHNRKFMAGLNWNIALTHVFETVVKPVLDNNGTLITVRQRLYAFRNNLARINDLYGPAFIPSNYVFGQKKEKIFLLRIPYEHLKQAQLGYVAKHGYVKNFGKGFPSDNAGDGPYNIRKYTLVNNIGCESGDLLFAYCYFFDQNRIREIIGNSRAENIDDFVQEMHCKLFCEYETVIYLDDDDMNNTHIEECGNRYCKTGNYDVIQRLFNFLFHKFSALINEMEARSYMLPFDNFRGKWIHSDFLNYCADCGDNLSSIWGQLSCSTCGVLTVNNHCPRWFQNEDEHIYCGACGGRLEGIYPFLVCNNCRSLHDGSPAFTDFYLRMYRLEGGVILRSHIPYIPVPRQDQFVSQLNGNNGEWTNGDDFDWLITAIMTADLTLIDLGEEMIDITEDYYCKVKEKIQIQQQKFDDAIFCLTADINHYKTKSKPKITRRPPNKAKDQDHRRLKEATNLLIKIRTNSQEAIDILNGTFRDNINLHEKPRWMGKRYHIKNASSVTFYNECEFNNPLSSFVCESSRRLQHLQLDKQIFGGGGFITNKVKNSGTGGKSKVNKTPHSGLDKMEQERCRNVADRLGKGGDDFDWDPKKLRKNLNENIANDNPAILKTGKVWDHSGIDGDDGTINEESGDSDGSGMSSDESAEPGNGGSGPTNGSSGGGSSGSGNDDISASSIITNYWKDVESLDITPPPKSRSLFTTDEIVGDLAQFTWNNIVQYDCSGSPFCGYVAMRLAHKWDITQIDVDELCDAVDEVPDDINDPTVDKAFNLGEPTYLQGYAKFKGFNLIIVTDIYDETYCKARVGKYGVISCQMYDECFKWVILNFKPNDPDDVKLGHYVLMVMPKISPTLNKLPEFPNVTSDCWFYDFTYKIKVVNEFVADAYIGTDQRSASKKRDEIESEDQYSTVEITEVLNVNWTNIKIVVMCLSIAGSFFGLGMVPTANLMFINSVLALSTPPDKYDLSTRRITVSNMLFNDDYQSIQITPYTPLKRTTMLTKKYINTKHDLTNVMKNTADLLQITSDQIHNGVDVQILPNEDLVQYNMPTSYSVITKKVKESIVGMELDAFNLYGGGKVNSKLYPNHIVKIRIKRDSCKTKIPIATAPCDCVYNYGVPVSPGMLPVTDQIGIITAFAGRSMSKPPPNQNDEILEEFTNFFKQFYQPMIDQMDFSEIVEEYPPDYFKSHYRGKRPKIWIDGMVRQYNEFEEGIADRGYDKNSCFVKLENSTKDFEGQGFAPKPRLIMTMSPVLLMEYCQFMKIIDKWNEGPIKEYQIKHESVEEMIAKVLEVQDGYHNVTDYSSFECSIVGKIRECEDWLILSLLRKARMHRTFDSYKERVKPGRYLKSQGITMFINSRNSGDFHTSFGNGVMNIALAQFQSYRKTGKLCKMVGEGDDAVVPKGVMDVGECARLGFKFSEDVCGSYPGDTDFLQKRWIEGKMYLNVGKMFSTFWVKNKANLKKSKQKFILRCMASSLHHLSPGHPVLYAIVNRIMNKTKSYNTPFKNWNLHINLHEYRYIDVNSVPRYVECDESMRAEIAKGALGFPPIPIDVQIELEKVIMSSEHIDLEGCLDNYPNILNYVSSDNTDGKFSSEVLHRSLYDMINEINEIMCTAKPIKLISNNKTKIK